MSYGFTWTSPGEQKIGFLEESDFTKDGKMDISKNSSLATVGNVKSSDVCLVEIYADWCGYCKLAKPIYDEVAKEVSKKGNNVKLFKINGTGEQSKSDPKRKKDEMKLMGRIKTIFPDFQGFPSFYFFKNGKRIGKHEGEVGVEELIQSIQQMVKNVKK